jgi:5-methyltetrahydrofolate--homocysteine methyltransferase
MLYYKSDWDKAKENLEAFWRGEDIGRPLMAVFARRNKDSEQFPALQHGPWVGGMEGFNEDDTEAISNWWINPEENFKRMKYWFENTYFGGEAIPATYVNWGASAAAAFFGSTPRFRKTSVWYTEVITDWENWKWEFDEKTNVWWKKIRDIVVYLIERAKGEYLVGMPEFGNAADNLSLMRGMDNLAMDCLENPEEIEKAIDFMDAWWIDLHEKLYRLTLPVNEGGGILPWMSLWAPGRIDQLACDFSTILSPATFKNVFVRDIEQMGAWTEYGMYHLDGKNCMRNMLDILLEIECIKAIEFTPGVGSLPAYTEEYIPRYQKILESGKRLYLLAEPSEVEPLCKALPSKGLYLCTFAGGKEDADRLIANTYKWSRKVKP